MYSERSKEEVGQREKRLGLRKFKRDKEEKWEKFRGRLKGGRERKIKKRNGRNFVEG